MRIVNIFDDDALVPDFVRSEIKAAQDGGHKYLLVVCDTFEDHEVFGFDPLKGALPGCDYPVYCKDEAELQERHDEFDGKNMQEVRGVYQVLQEADLSNTYCLVCGETGELHCHTGIELKLAELLENMRPSAVRDVVAQELAERLKEGEKK